MTVEKMRVKYFRDTTFKLENTSDGEWVKVVNSCVSHYYGTHTPIYLRLGFALDIPEGYEVHFVSKWEPFESEWSPEDSSGLSLVKGVEVVDNNYVHDAEMYDDKYDSEDDKSLSDKDIRRELAFLFESPFGGFLPRGATLLKFRLVKKQPDIVFEEVDFLNDTINK